MNIPADIQSFHFSSSEVKAYIPSPEFIQQRQKNNQGPFPYWAQVWSAAKALCEVMAAEPSLIKNKRVLEIAAGLGLPSLLAAVFAKEVIATDYIEDAVNIMQRSAAYNQFTNMRCIQLDWNTDNINTEAEVLLLSDINYEPSGFDAL